MTVITKELALVQSAETQDPNGAFEVILSAPTKDRDGETLLPDEWDQPLPDHITFDIDHGMSVATTVGSGRPAIHPDGTLRVSGTYASTALAQETRALVSEGHIRTTSVAFLRKPSAKKDGKKRSVRELLNGAFVAVPSNREALVLSSKAFDLDTKVGARNSKTDAEHIQAAHDHMAAMGADCSAGKGLKNALDSAAGSDTGKLALSVAVGLDKALTALDALDKTPELTSAITLVETADDAVDALLKALGVTDPDQEDEDTEDDEVPAKAAAHSAAANAGTDDVDLRGLLLRYRSLQALAL